MKKLLCVSIVVITLALAPSLESQQVGGSAPGPAVEEVPFIFLPSPTIPETEAASRPVPRLADGTVDLTGPWVGGGSNVDIEFEGGLKPGELPLLPWARELRDKRDKKDEPYTSCLPMGVPRVNPYPWKFAMTYTPKGLTHIYVLHETGDAGAHRVIHMDGRKHPVDPLPTWFGHSIGSWDGDTLVVDTVGYNDKFWFDSRGTPHTEQLHTVERYTRINWGRLRHVFLLDDPGAFSRPVTLSFTARLLRADLKTGGGELMEFICLEDNQYGAASGLTPGGGTSPK
ncbi:MAG: hypothetical protein A3I61_17075 [Acidobacteria bacterium RIFCSPLOWO2_02_FULL_68_18]|nr:MAG: hypothetical protein A3I61_17075 [Acidobacteria bacterium RIFCSPLOWO2_02_FULL_68_18]